MVILEECAKRPLLTDFFLRHHDDAEKLILFPVEKAICEHGFQPIAVCHVCEVLHLHIALAVRNFLVAVIVGAYRRNLVEAIFQIFLYFYRNHATFHISHRSF